MLTPQILTYMRKLEFDSVLYVIGAILVLLGAFMKIKDLAVADYVLGSGIVLNAVVFFVMMFFTKADTDTDYDEE